jgi:hypothetical protein
MVPFSIHAAKGLLRDQRARRAIMAISLIITLALLVCGRTVLRELLDRHEHPGRFVLYWLICAWQTLLLLLLALLDILLAQAEARRARQQLREEAQRASGVTPQE